MSFPFISCDEMRRLDPNYGRQKVNAPPPQPPPKASAAIRTPASIVQEATSRNSRTLGTANFTETEDETGAFVCIAKMGRYSGEGSARAKKLAKQKACYELLKGVIKNDCYADFDLPGTNQKEALKYLESIKPVDDQPLGDGPANENWINKLLEFCQKNKIDMPVYTYAEEGQPNDRTYTVYCKIGQNEEHASSRQKKGAKGLAAQKLLMVIEKQMNDLKAAKAAAEKAAEEEQEDVDEGVLAAPAVDMSMAEVDPDPQSTLKGILDDQTRFAPGYELFYKNIEFPSTIGRMQTLLTVGYSRASEKRAEVSSSPDGRYAGGSPPSQQYVFCGEGVDVPSARTEAARSALFHFLTY